MNRSSGVGRPSFPPHLCCVAQVQSGGIFNTEPDMSEPQGDCAMMGNLA
jgi:hypothetical protein